MFVPQNDIQRPVTLRLYAYKVIPEELRKQGEVTKYDWMAIDTVERVAQYLAKRFNGRTDCSSCGTVQYSDTLYLTISNSCVKQIIKDFPFISETFKSQYGFDAPN